MRFLPCFLIQSFYKSLFFASFMLSFCAFGQLEIDAGMNREQLTQFFSNGTSIEILRVRYKGVSRAIGTFTDSDSLFGMARGLVLSTGSVRRIARKNKSSGTSSRNFRGGDKYLDKIANSHTKDAVLLEITFIPLTDFVSFNYVFGSEEYPEYAGSNYSDAFGFYLKPPKGKTINLAHIPESTDKICVNSVNHFTNPWFYVNNTPLMNIKQTVITDTSSFWKGELLYQVTTTYNTVSAMISDPNIPVEFDGFTKLLQAKAKVIPGEKYMLSIRLADASDRVFDSGVLIEAGSFLANPNEHFKFGLLASDSNYYFTRDTILLCVDKPDNIEEIPFVCKDTSTTVFYDLNESALSFAQQMKLQQLFAGLNPMLSYKIMIRSFTDNEGSAAFNSVLAAKRSDMMRKSITPFLGKHVEIESVEGLGIDLDETKSQAGKRRTELLIRCESDSKSQVKSSQ